MNLKLEKTTLNNEFIIENYIKFMHLHYQEGLKIGIDDPYAKDYDERKFSECHDDSEDFFLIKIDDKNVGFLSIIDSYYDESVIVLLSLYILEEYRENGYATKAIQELKRLTEKQLDIQVWYGLPAENLYKKMGKEVAKIYRI